MNYLYGSIAILLVLLGVEQYGEHRTQVKWDLETARLEAIAKQEKESNRKALDAIAEQHRKDIQNAKSEAGKSAIRDYLRTHGMLPSQGSDTQAQSTQGANEPASQCGTGVETEEFATRCASDALTILRWQEWAQRENLEVE